MDRQSSVASNPLGTAFIVLLILVDAAAVQRHVTILTFPPRNLQNSPVHIY